MIDCFKGILMTHDLDIFESGKNLGLNGLKQLYYFFLSSYFFSLCFVVLALNNNDYVDSVIVFYIIPSFTHSSLVLNLSEWVYSAEHECYSKEGGNPNSCWSSETYIVFFLSIKVNVDQQLFGYPRSSKYLILCSAQEINEYRFGTTCEWVNIMTEIQF